MEQFDEVDLNHILVAVQKRMESLRTFMYNIRSTGRDEEWRSMDNEWEALKVVEIRTLKMLEG